MVGDLYHEVELLNEHAGKRLEGEAVKAKELRANTVIIISEHLQEAYAQNGGSDGQTGGGYNGAGAKANSVTFCECG